MIIDESEYLEHYGVPGMKWGVRRARSHRQGPIEKRVNGQLRKAGKAYRAEGQGLTPQQQKVKQERNRMIRNAALGTAGAGVAAYLIAKNSNKRVGVASKEIRVDNHLRNAAKLRQSLGQNKVPKTTKKSTRFSDASDLAKMRAHAQKAVQEANAQLRARDNEFNIPFAERVYLKEWT